MAYSKAKLESYGQQFTKIGNYLSVLNQEAYVVSSLCLGLSAPTTHYRALGLHSSFMFDVEMLSQWVSH
jgi:hypothetical protein